LSAAMIGMQAPFPFIDAKIPGKPQKPTGQARFLSAETRRVRFGRAALGSPGGEEVSVEIAVCPRNAHGRANTTAVRLSFCRQGAWH
jgi:hypothetical protein